MGGVGETDVTNENVFENQCSHWDDDIIRKWQICSYKIMVDK